MKAHEHLYKIAIKLSIYSSILDFGLMLSVFLLNSKIVPYSLSSFMTSTFSIGISYLTATIILLFSLSFLLRFKQKFVTIDIKDTKPKYTPIKVKVSIADEPKKEPSKVYIKQNVGINTNDEPIIQRVSNDNKSFVKVNGVWYLAGKDKFERIKLPNLH